MTRVTIIALATTFSFYRGNKPQGLFVLLGLVLGCGLYTAVEQINTSARASYAEADKILGASSQLRISDRQQTEVSVDDYIKLRRSGFSNVYPVIEARLPTTKGPLISVIATDLLALPITSAAQETDVENPFSGGGWSRLTQPPYEMWVPAQTAKKIGVRDGDRIELRDGTRLPPASVRSQAQQNDRVFMDIGAALDVLGKDRLSYIAAGALDDHQQTVFDEDFSDRLALSRNTDALDLSQLTQSLHTNLTALGLLSFVVGVFIIFNAVHFSLHARTHLFRVLGELGVPTEAVILAIVIETLIWSLVGAILGTLLAQPISAALMPAVASTMQNIYGASVSSVPIFNGELFVQAFALATIGLALALMLPLMLIVAKPASRVTTGPNDPARRSSGLLAAAGVIMLLAVYASYPHVSSPLQGFGLLGLILFAGIALLPAAVISAASFGKAAIGDAWLGRWAFADIISQLPHLRLALMALLLTLIANIGVTTLVGSFRFALTDWLETRLSADYYVSANALSSTDLIGQSWLSAAHQRKVAKARFAGREVEVLGIDVTAPDFQQSSVIAAGPDAFARWINSANTDTPIFANEQIRYLAGVKVGDSIKLMTDIGPHSFRVIGFFHDYGNTKYAVHLPKQRFDTFYPRAEVQGWSIWTTQENRMKTELALNKLGVEPAALISQNDVLILSMSIFDRTFAITRALNALTLLVAGVAIFASLLSVYQLRRPEYALWRALGMHWIEFFWVAGFPILLMSAVVMVVSLPMGVILSWLLIHKINVISFGWTMPVVLDAGSIAFLFGVIILLVSTAFLLASLGQRSSVNRALKQLAGE